MKNQKYNESGLIPFIIQGAEGDNDPSGDPASQSSDNPPAGKGDAEGDSNSAGNGHDDADHPNVQGLKSALQKERLGRQADSAELKELRKLKKAYDEAELAKKSDIDRALTKAEKAEERAAKLAAGFRDREVNSAISAAAKALNFIDTDDAIAGVDRAAFSVEQDEDDPTIVTVDKKSIETAVKALATKKPHFVKSGTDDGEPSGSQFGGQKKKQQTSDETLKTKYPSLR